jgi:hypothetical protein
MRSTQRERIVGPRKKSARSKSPLKIAIWVALIAVVVAAVVTTVVMLFGGSEAAKHERAAVPPPVIADAAQPAVEIDAAPEAVTLEVMIHTEPAGAMIAVDGVDKGPAPVALKLVVHDHFTDIVASTPDYDDKKITVNTYVNKDKAYTIKLKRTPKGSAAVRIKTPLPPSKDPSGAPSSNKTGGELGGNPFKTGASTPSTTAPPTTKAPKAPRAP